MAEKQEILTLQNYPYAGCLAGNNYSTNLFYSFIYLIIPYLCPQQVPEGPRVCLSKLLKEEGERKRDSYGDRSWHWDRYKHPGVERAQNKRGYIFMSIDISNFSL